MEPKRNNSSRLIGLALIALSFVGFYFSMEFTQLLATRMSNVPFLLYLGVVSIYLICLTGIGIGGMIKVIQKPVIKRASVNEH